MKIIRSVERAILIIEIFRNERKPLSLKKLYELTELPKATLLRFLHTMINEGYLVMNKDDNTYFLSPVFLDLSNVVLDNFDLRTTVRPIMEKLKEMCNETINLYIPNGINRICIEQVTTDHIVKNFSKIGDTMPLYCGAAGKALLAYSQQKIIDEVVEKTELKAFTVNTITNLTDLNNELEKIKNCGYAISNSEREENIVSIAAPIFNYSKEIVAAMTISGPAYRIEDKIDSLKILLVGEVEKISYTF